MYEECKEKEHLQHLEKAGFVHHKHCTSVFAYQPEFSKNCQGEIELNQTDILSVKVPQHRAYITTVHKSSYIFNPKTFHCNTHYKQIDLFLYDFIAFYTDTKRYITDSHYIHKQVYVNCTLCPLNDNKTYNIKHSSVRSQTTPSHTVKDSKLPILLFITIGPAVGLVFILICFYGCYRKYTRQKIINLHSRPPSQIELISLSPLGSNENIPATSTDTEL